MITRRPNQLSLATFILTFFTSQAYQYWRNVYFTTRAIQGRINDVCLLISLGAERGVCDMDSCDVDAMALRPGFVGYSDEGAQLVRRCTRLIKKSHTFFWAATPTCSNVRSGGWCAKKGAQGKCGKSKFVGRLCASTCGTCGQQETCAADASKKCGKWARNCLKPTKPGSRKEKKMVNLALRD